MSAEAERIEEIFQAAIEQPSELRSNFVRDACGGDERVLGEVTAFLRAHDAAGNFLERPAIEVRAEAFAQDDDALSAGESLGDFRIISLLGKGGMGEVYLAEDTALGRKVAIKLVQRGYGTGGTARHLRQEARIVAGLNDPHIARLFGVAATPEHVPYFIMEYVDGERLDVYCENHRLPTNERLRLFRKICAAVSYAHRHLVIHRDIKPANIRVTADGEPKLLDFGIAKLLAPETTQTNDQTQTLASVMTPHYASPEQVRGESMTTASDIYSLGVVLYELLTGERPARLTSSAPVEIARAIIEQEPLRPSAHRRGLDPDLDNIILMALRKEPERRYPSVGQFSEDIRRHLAGLPVFARKETWSYRGSKFIRRHRLGVAVASLFILTLLGGIIATTWQARRANRRFDDVRQLAHSFLFEIEPQIADLPGATAARETLVKRALEYLDRLSQEASGNRGLQAELAAAYEKVGDVQGEPNQANLGDMAGALASYHKAQNLRKSLLNHDPTSVELRNGLAHNDEQIGYLLWWSNRTKDAVAAYDKALALRVVLTSEQPASHPLARALADLEMHYGDIPAWNQDASAALLHFHKALPILEGLAISAPNDIETRTALGRCLTRIGSAQKTAGDFAAAEKTFLRALAVTQSLADQQPNSYSVKHHLWLLRFSQCELYLEQRDAAKALAICPEMTRLVQALHDKDPNDASMLHNVSVAHSYTGEANLLAKNYPIAIAEFQQAIELDTLLAERSPDSAEYTRSRAVCWLGIGKAQLGLEQPDAALASQQRARAMLEKVVDSDRENPIPRSDLASVLQQIGEIHARARNKAEAHRWFQLALDTVEQNPPATLLTNPDRTLIAELKQEMAE